VIAMPRLVGVLASLLLPLVTAAALSLVGAPALLLVASATVAQVPGLLVPDDPMQGLRLGESIRGRFEEFRDYHCSPSVEFPGLTFCQKIRFERDRHGSYNAMHSFLHTRAGTLVYVDRYQRPAVLDTGEATQRIEQISRDRAETPRTRTMPQRPGLPDGVLAVWGETVLDPLTDARVAAIAKGQAEVTEFLVDFLGDATRSARERLPIWRFAGGAGFVWVASLDPRGQSSRGQGFLRQTAVDASAIAKSK
jgi:hypothetical protein